MVTPLADVPAHVVAPKGVELKQSSVSSNETGAWCTEKLTTGSKFGPFVGRTLQEGKEKKVDFRYAWEVYDPETHKLVHIVDATDPQHGNWMRYVNCARYLEEQNLVSIQEGSHIFYRAIRDISPGEELLTWYSKEDTKVKRKRKNSVKKSSTAVSESPTPPKVRKKPGPKPKKDKLLSGLNSSESSLIDTAESKGKVTPKTETPKVKVGKDSVIKKKKVTKEDKNIVDGKEKKRQIKKTSSDLEEFVNITKQTLADGVKEGVIKGQDKVTGGQGHGRGSRGSKRGARGGRGGKSPSKSTNPNSSASPRGRGRGRGRVKSPGVGKPGIKKSPGETPSPGDKDVVKKKISTNGKLRGVGRGNKQARSPNPSVKVKKTTDNYNPEDIPDKLWSLVNDKTFGMSSSAKEGEYNFEILSHHGINGKLGKKLYKCDICSGVYRHAFSLKRHYLRNHIYCYYLSEADVSNCKIAVGQQEASVKNKPKYLPPKVTIKVEDKSADKDYGYEMDGTNGASAKPDGDTASDKAPKCSVQTRPNPVVFPGLYRCSICHKLFDYIEDLKSHTADHPTVTSEKMHACNQCDMKFAYKQNLMRHQAVHTGLRPYVCKTCDRSFPSSPSLKKHERMHTGKAPKCRHCKAAFTWRVELKRHMQKRHSEYLHHCPYCNKSFLARSAFQRHITSHENDPINISDSATFDDVPPEVPKKGKAVKARNGKEKLSRKKKPFAKVTRNKRRQFRFSCGVCKKRFHNYVNMCRHKRLAHPEQAQKEKPTPKEKTEIKPEEIKTEVDEEPEWLPCDANFFAGVADNIAYNLCNHIDGGTSSIQNFFSHIKIEDYKSVTEVHSWENPNLTPRDRIWTRYNFPSGYEPIMTEEEVSDGPVVPVSKTVEVDVKTEQGSSEVDSPTQMSPVLKIPQIRRCTLCNCVFSNSDSFDSHMQEKHSKSTSSQATDDSSIVEAGNCESTVSTEDTGLGQSVAIVCNDEDDEDSGSHSPFHEYQEIAFGKHGDLKYICAVCKKDFQSAMDLGFHQFKKHPTIDCNYLEVEGECHVDKLFYPVPVQSGELAETKKKPLDSRENHSFTCTRCLSHFSTVTRLYIHIINCAPKPKVKSLPGITKSKFASQRSPVVKNRFQDEKKRKYKAENDFQADGNEKKRAFKGCRRRTVVTVPDPDVSRGSNGRRQRGGLLYNPRNHVRRREMTEVLERHQCNGCGCKFQTISLLERHIRKCEEKEKLRSVRPLKRGAGDQLSLKSKLTCRYCSRQFTYLKFLVNHYRDFCRIRKEKLSRGGLTEEDYKDEERIKAAALSAANRELERRESSEVAMNGDGAGNVARVKRGWPRGMKRKKGRKNHCWTYIKKRKSSDGASSSPTSSCGSESTALERRPVASALACKLDFEKLTADVQNPGSVELDITHSNKDKGKAKKDYSEVQPPRFSLCSERLKPVHPKPNSNKPFLKKRKLTLLESKSKNPTLSEVEMKDRTALDTYFIPIPHNIPLKPYKVKRKSITANPNAKPPKRDPVGSEIWKSKCNDSHNKDKQVQNVANLGLRLTTKCKEECGMNTVQGNDATDKIIDNGAAEPAQAPLDLSSPLVDNCPSSAASDCLAFDDGNKVRSDFSEKLGLAAVEKTTETSAACQIKPERPKCKKDVKENDSSDEDNTVLAKLVDTQTKRKNRSPGLKLVINNDPSSASSLSSSKETKKKLVQSTLPSMFSATKSAKQKAKNAINKKSDNEPPFDEIHKMLDALQSPDPLDAEEIFHFSASDKQAAISENSCSSESVVSR